MKISIFRCTMTSWWCHNTSQYGYFQNSLNLTNIRLIWKVWTRVIQIKNILRPLGHQWRHWWRHYAKKRVFSNKSDYFDIRLKWKVFLSRIQIKYVWSSFVPLASSLCPQRKHIFYVLRPFKTQSDRGSTRAETFKRKYSSSLQSQRTIEA